MEQRTITNLQLNNEKYTLMYFLPFYPLLSCYRIGPLNLATIALAILLFFDFAVTHRSIKLQRQQSVYFLFIGYAVFSDICNMLFGHGEISAMLNRILEYVLMFCLMIWACSLPFNEENLFKGWKIAGTIYMLGLLYHVIQLYVLGQTIEPISIIPGVVVRERFSAVRPSSFFPEPAAFVDAMLPLLFLSLKKQNYKWAAVTTASVIASTSTTGIVLVIVLWVYYIFRRGKNKHRLFAVAACVLIGYLVFTLDVFSGAVEKVNKILEGKGTLQSRMLVGFDIVWKMNPLEKLLGTTYHVYSDYVTANIDVFAGSTAVLRYHLEGRLFMNTFSELIFRYGILGLVLFGLTMKGKLFDKQYGASGFAAMLCVEIFSQTMLFNPYYFLCALILLLYGKAEPKEIYNENRCDHNTLYP